MEETAEAVMFGIGRFLAGRDMDGVKRTDATFRRSGNRALPKVDSSVSRSSYRAGWQRLIFRITLASGVTEGGCLLGRNPDATMQTAQDLWENWMVPDTYGGSPGILTLLPGTSLRRSRVSAGHSIPSVCVS
ncbi:hypothetical protein [Streptomyces halobius]|uniref:Uncharacterized protein n=1 Tax=Streptomyces halobius TaxID=2879846 RepID=A0ABY4M016_9ACTN|nr:hypothetical protein [Streptomyces halobius]UQA90558.1 hypothetical protein K9S39_00355 [Streptomyces halobius]